MKKVPAKLQDQQPLPSELGVIDEETSKFLQEDDLAPPVKPGRSSRIHPVPGYADSENMWTRLCNLDSPSPAPANQFKNHRSLVKLNVSDKMFKMKKNPFWKDKSRLAQFLQV